MAVKEFELLTKIRSYVYDIDSVVFKMKKSSRPVLGDDIRHESYYLVKEVNLANSSCATSDMPRDLVIATLKNRIVHIDHVLASLKTLGFLLDMASDKKIIHDNANARLMYQAVPISRMAISWSKQTKEKLVSMTCGG